jgi:hypothetical protein
MPSDMNILAACSLTRFRASVRALALFATCVAVPAVVYAAAPAYLADMPTPAQVVAAIHGSDPIDTAVQQSEALRQLCWVVRSLSEGGEVGNKITPEETALCASYSKEATAVTKGHSEVPTYGPNSWVLRAQHYQNESFRDDVLSHFPKAKADYDAKPHPGSGASELTSDVGDWFGPKLMGMATLVSVLLGVALFWLAVRLGGGGGRPGEKKIVRKLDAAALGIAPPSPGVVLEELCIGATANHFSYTAGIQVNVSAGTASGGGTASGTYQSFDFGCAVHNQTPAAIRFQLTFAEVDGQGYTLNTVHLREDIAAGEKRRLWAGLSLREISHFARYVIKEVRVDAAPGNEQRGATFASRASNLNLLQAFGLSASAAKLGSAGRSLAIYVLKSAGVGMFLLATVCGIAAFLKSR